MTEFPAGLSALTDRYDVLLCDVWGVIHNGVHSFPEACDAMVAWRAPGGQVVLISNAPRPSYDVIPQLDELGVPLWANGPIKSALAVRLCAEYGKPVPQDVALAYEEGRRLVIKRSVTPPVVSLDGVLNAPESTRWWTDGE